MRYLVRKHGGRTKPVAELLGISQRTVERYVKNQIKKPRPELAERLEREMRTRRQPQIRARAKNAATTSGIMIDVRARFGYTAAPGSTDQARVRHLTLALPPHHAARLLAAQEADGTEDQLRQVAAEAWARSTSATTDTAPTASKSNSTTSSASSSNCNRTGPGPNRKQEAGSRK
ncbi:hypothetical protein I3F58_20960 [Streptomyces sp. MUM 203J]|nr:hypothetical protein [Streptomyces sp. MUM 203J]